MQKTKLKTNIFNNNFNIDLLINISRRKQIARAAYFERNDENNIKGRHAKSNEIDHDLKGKTVLAYDTKKQYTVDKVFRQWHKGYYIVLALVDDNRSHRMFFWKNINSQDSTIIRIIDENNHLITFE